MKKPFLFYILACITSLFIFTSCEDNTDLLSKTRPDTGKEITNRTIDDCDDCPLNYCCCSVTLVNGPEGTITFCGVYTNSVGAPCSGSPSSPCSNFSGSTSLVYISSTQRGLFCVPPGSTFSIYNPHGSSITLRFTCQHDHVDPISETINIAMMSTGYFYNNGDCIIQLC